MKIVVTGFDPFGEDSINPSIEAVKRLPDTIKNAQIIKMELPTVFHESAKLVYDIIEKEVPDVILHVGQAGGRAEITPERVAINLDDARIPDNANQQPLDQPIQADGENAYFSQLPIKAMVEYMKRDNIPASISNSAGTFVCNHMMYQSLYLTNTKFPNTKAGFIHIPFIPEQVVNRPDKPSLALDEIVKGLVSSIEAIVDFEGKADIKTVGGKIH